jgi:hypothetical protein
VVTLTTNHGSTPVTDTEYLRGEISRLLRDLAAARLLSANRLAAIRAALGAARDGETNPLSYLRDQLAEETGKTGAHRSGH